MDKLQAELEALKDANGYRKRVAVFIFIGCALSVTLLFGAIGYLTINFKFPDVSDNVFIVWLVSKALIITAVAGVTAKAMRTASLLLIPLHERDLLMNLSANSKPQEKPKTAPAEDFQIDQRLSGITNTLDEIAGHLNVPKRPEIEEDSTKFKRLDA